MRHCVTFGYRYLISANHCHTALWTIKLTVAQLVTVLFYRHKCCFNKQLSNKHIFTALSYFPCTTVSYINTHTQHVSTYPALWCTEATIKLFPHCSHLTNIHCTVPPAVSVTTPQSLYSHNNSQWPTCFHALHKASFRKAVILLPLSDVLSQCICSCG